MRKDVLCVVVDVFPAVGTSLREKKSKDGKTTSDTRSLCKHKHFKRQDSLIPVLAALESECLCGRQMIVTDERGN